MITNELKREYRFQFTNAGYRVGYRAEGALQLARASLLLSQLEHSELISIVWEYDQDSDRGPIDWGWSESDIKRWNQSKHTVQYCAIHDTDGLVLASLGGIWDADNRYRRVVEAELALGCIDQLESIADEPSGLQHP